MSQQVEEPRGREVEMLAKHRFRFEKLTVWQSARRLAGEVYAATQAFPKDEMFGLTSQIRRAAVSIVANIAEGSGRNSDPDFAHFLEMAYGSAMELAALLHVASDTGRIEAESRDALLGLLSEVTNQLTALNRSLRVERSKTPFPRPPHD
jgi:four helix bundle protein